MPTAGLAHHIQRSQSDSLFHKFESLTNVVGREPSGDSLYIPEAEVPETYHSYFFQSLVVKKFFWFYVTEFIPN